MVEEYEVEVGAYLREDNVVEEKMKAIIQVMLPRKVKESMRLLEA